MLENMEHVFAISKGWDFVIENIISIVHESKKIKIEEGVYE